MDAIGSEMAEGHYLTAYRAPSIPRETPERDKHELSHLIMSGVSSRFVKISVADAVPAYDRALEGLP